MYGKKSQSIPFRLLQCHNASTRFDFEMSFSGHGLGRLLSPNSSCDIPPSLCRNIQIARRGYSVWASRQGTLSGGWPQRNAYANGAYLTDSEMINFHWRRSNGLSNYVLWIPTLIEDQIDLRSFFSLLLIVFYKPPPPSFDLNHPNAPLAARGVSTASYSTKCLY